MNEKKYLYKAKKISDGEEVIGAYLNVPGTPFAYIATIESMNKMIVDELDDGKTTNLYLTRVMKHTVKRIDTICEKG